MDKNKGVNILINNVVPLNNGDVALFYCLYTELKKAGYTVKIACYNYGLAKKLYPDLPLVKELGQSFLFFKLAFLKPLLIPFLFFFSKHYRKSDVIIGAPGGYVNSFYKIKNSLSVFKISKFFKKHTFIYAQSVGPLNKKDSLYFKKIAKKYIDFIFVRDTFSKKQVEDLGIKNFILSKDAAFLLGINEAKKSVKSKKVAVSVRTWNFDGNSIALYKRMIINLVRETLKRGYSIEFLSTCQGVENYKDDSIIAKEIYNLLTEEEKMKCKVIDDYYNFSDFYKKLEEYNFVIGTRLHMCITSLTKIIPSFNISYEIKAKECYNYLGISEYSIDYNEDLDKATSAFTFFLETKENLRSQLPNKIEKVYNEVKNDFNILKEKIATS